MSTFVIRNPDASIAFFAEKASDLVLVPGQTVEELAVSFVEYASRLVLSVEGVSGQTLTFYADKGEVTVQISAPRQASVDLLVNDLTETVALKDGAGQLILSRQNPGVFIIAPANRQLYPAAGSSFLAVIISPSP